MRFQGSLANPELPGRERGGGSTIFRVSRRFDPNNSNSVFVNQNFLAAGFSPLAILPSGLPGGPALRERPMCSKMSFGVEKDLGHDLFAETLPSNSTRWDGT